MSFEVILKDSTVGESSKFWSNGEKGPVPIVLLALWVDRNLVFRSSEMYGGVRPIRAL